MRPSAALLCLALAAPAAAVAGPTARFTVDDYAGWEAGEARDAIITSLGDVTPGWSSTPLALDQVGGVWAAVRGPGDVLYLGSDRDGGVYEVRGRQVKRLAALAGAVAAVSLALGPDGALYAGSMPGGKV